MTQEVQAKKAFDEAQKEFDEQSIKELKGFVLKTLQAIENAKKTVAQKNEEIRVLKLDLEDLRHGRVDEIRERQEKSAVAKQVSQIPLQSSSMKVTRYSVPANWYWTATAGTYNIATSTDGTTTTYLSI